MKRHILAIVLVIVFIVLSYLAYPVEGSEARSKYAYGAEDYWQGYADGYGEALQFINIADKSERTVGEVSLFLAQDDTDKQNLGNCARFTARLVHNAMGAGFKCDTVTLLYENSVMPHAIVAFPTTLGLIYVEPQSDLIIYDIAKHFGRVSHIVRWL